MGEKMRVAEYGIVLTLEWESETGYAQWGRSKVDNQWIV